MSEAILPEPSEPLVHIRGLTRVFRVGPSQVRALDGLDLDVAAGEIVAVVGVSGSGKSTLLHLMGGLDTATSGSLRVDGRELTGLDPYELVLHRRRTVGFVFQSFHLVGSMSAEANVALALTLQGTYGGRRRTLARDALRRVGLADRLTHRPGELSGGEQQRVAIARALVHGPRLLLADEPTGNLDRSTADGVVALLEEVRDQGTAVVLVTHDEEIARRVADRIVRLWDGRVAAQGAGTR